MALAGGLVAPVWIGQPLGLQFKDREAVKEFAGGDGGGDLDAGRRGWTGSSGGRGGARLEQRAPTLVWGLQRAHAGWHGQGIVGQAEQVH